MALKSEPDYAALAKEWAKINNYKLESIEEGNKKFTFNYNAISFYAYAPDNDTEGWVRIWSMLWCALVIECFTYRMYGAATIYALMH